MKENNKKSPLPFSNCTTPFTSEYSPLVLSRISAGFPSPADDYIEQTLDLNQYLVPHPSATFFIRVEGESMVGAGIFSGDILIVDRAVEPNHNKIVVAILNGEFTVKRLKISENQVWLTPENPDYTPVFIGPDTDFEVWGVVTCVLHRV